MINLDDSFKINDFTVIDEIDDLIELNDYTNDPRCSFIDVRQDRGEPPAQGVVR